MKCKFAMVHLVDLQNAFIFTARNEVWSKVMFSQASVVLSGGESVSGGLGRPPRDTTNDWAVRILLECILVLVMQKFIHCGFIFL